MDDKRDTSGRAKTGLTVGKSYRVKFTLDMGNCGNLHIPLYDFGTATYETMPETGISLTASGNYEGTFTAKAANTSILIEMVPEDNPPPDSVGYYWIDNFSIEEITPAYGLKSRNHWTIVKPDNGRIKVSSYSVWGEAHKLLKLTPGKQYRVRYNLAMGNSSFLHVIVSNPADGSYVSFPETGVAVSESGTYSGTFTAAASGLELRFQLPQLPANADTGYFYLSDVWVDEIVPNNGGGGVSGGEGYRYGFNGKELDKEVSNTTTYDYGFRIYSPGLGRFLSVDPLTKSYPYYTPYQFAGNMPIAATDLDGMEVKVSFDYATVTKDRTSILIKSSVEIKIQIINLSAISNDKIDLQNIAVNLSSDLSNKLSGKSTSIMNLPFIFKSKGNKVIGVESTKTVKDNKDYSVTYNTDVSTDVSVVNDISKIDKDAWVFVIVDKVNNQKNRDIAGLADVKGGKVTIGEAQYFEGRNAYNEGRQLSLHEILHLLGASDTYPPHSGLPGTQNDNNAMYFISPENKRRLTKGQIVKEIMTATVGGIWEIFTPGSWEPAKNPNSNTPTQQQLKTFINENGSATKIDNP